MPRAVKLPVAAAAAAVGAAKVRTCPWAADVVRWQGDLRPLGWTGLYDWPWDANAGEVVVAAIPEGPQQLTILEGEVVVVVVVPAHDQLLVRQPATRS